MTAPRFTESILRDRGYWQCRCGAWQRAEATFCGCGLDRPSAAEKPAAPATPKAKRQPKRSGAEALYAVTLAEQRLAGKIKWYLEQVTIPLPDGARFRADFLVGTDNGVEIHEVKGAHYGKHIGWSEAGVARFRAARALLPFLTFKLFRVTKRGTEEVA